MGMDLKLSNLFGDKPDAGAGRVELDMPTTQIRMAAAHPGYDPLGPTTMESARAGSLAAPKRLALIGHLPIVQQFQTLGVILVASLLIAAFLVYLDARQA